MLRGLFYILFVIIFLLGLILLPFFVWVRGAVYLYAVYELNSWLSLLASSILTWLVLYIYMHMLFKFVSGAESLPDWWIWLQKRVTLFVVIIALFFSMLFVSSGNAKTRKIKSDYGALHPILKMGISSVILFDRDLVMTDIQRNHGDYEKMGMGKVNNSLHFKQSDGFVHAVDLRTIGRSEVRNIWLESWIKILGFRTLRHVGTADHLHVSLILRENPRAL